jgi:hypothetical protein
MLAAGGPDRRGPENLTRAAHGVDRIPPFAAGAAGKTRQEGTRADQQKSHFDAPAHAFCVRSVQGQVDQPDAPSPWSKSLPRLAKTTAGKPSRAARKSLTFFPAPCWLVRPGHLDHHLIAREKPRLPDRCTRSRVIPAG